MKIAFNSTVFLQKTWGKITIVVFGLVIIKKKKLNIFMRTEKKKKAVCKVLELLINLHRFECIIRNDVDSDRYSFFHSLEISITL